MKAKEFEEYARVTEENLTKAWDALEQMSVRGYEARSRITVAQTMILNVFSLLKKLAKDVETEKEKRKAETEETDETAAGTPEEPAE